MVLEGDHKIGKTSTLFPSLWTAAMIKVALIIDMATDLDCNGPIMRNTNQLNFPSW